VTLYNEILPVFRKCDAELLDISVDGVWCHAAFARDRHLHFPLLADFAPKGGVATKYRASAGARACADHPFGIRRLCPHRALAHPMISQVHL
jgi:peroxiredoxin